MVLSMSVTGTLANAMEEVEGCKAMDMPTKVTIRMISLKEKVNSLWNLKE